jgi:hypothetical protein
MTKVREMVEEVLRNEAETRNSDILLLVAIWRRYFPEMLTGEGQFLNLKNLKELPQQASVKRERARFNSEAKYYPTNWEIAKRRGIKEDEWRKDLGYKTKHATRNPSKKDSYMDKTREYESQQRKLM